MPSTNDHPEYDENLLSSAPAPTKGMVQSGYATDLLEDKPKPPRRGDLESGRHKSLSKHTSLHTGARASAKGVEPKAASTTSLPKTTPKTPFYRTKRGIIILTIVAIVILAAIIAGAVGGALSHKGQTSSASSGQIVSNDPLNPGGQTKTTGDSGQGGAVPVSSTLSQTGVAATILPSPTGVFPCVINC